MSPRQDNGVQNAQYGEQLTTPIIQSFSNTELAPKRSIDPATVLGLRERKIDQS